MVRESNRKANGLGCLAGGLVFCLLFPLCVYVFGWLSFALGMSSVGGSIMMGILSLTLLFGGGFALPIFLSCAVGKAVIPFFKSNDRDGYAWYISILSKYLDDILGARGAPLPLAQ
ncbi:hypothetical protein [Microcystis aeruginosa]|uniref:hypothetical protein n=1 Tax=Microcystis aeruginosa TaxID=1126 RepID=UPI001E448EA7|nr:hypothetical protein [Microcystis aeruginosa]